MSINLCQLNYALTVKQSIESLSSPFVGMICRTCPIQDKIVGIIYYYGMRMSIFELLR